MLPGWAPTSVRWGSARVGREYRRWDAPVAPARRPRRAGRGGARAAETVTLWGCHGPGGEPLPFAYDASSTAEPRSSAPPAAAARPRAARCGSRSSVPIPRTGQAALRFAPAGRRGPRARLARPARDRPGLLGADLQHAARDAGRPGRWTASLFAGAVGDWVEVGLRCETPDPRCDVPDARVDLRFAALTVRDDAAPTFTADGVPRVATGTFAVAVDAARQRDRRRRASTATLGGRTVATAQAGQGRCAELSPADATADLPLAEDCPPSDRLVLVDRLHGGRRRRPAARAARRRRRRQHDGQGLRRARGQRPADAGPEPARRSRRPAGSRSRRRRRRADRPASSGSPAATRSPATARSRSARAARPRRRRRARSRSRSRPSSPAGARPRRSPPRARRPSRASARRSTCACRAAARSALKKQRTLRATAHTRGRGAGVREAGALGTISGVPVSGSSITRQRTPKTYSTSSASTTSAGLPRATTAPSRIAIRCVA